MRPAGPFHLCRITELDNFLDLRTVPHAYTCFGRFIAWHLRHPFLGEYWQGQSIFGPAAHLSVVSCTTSNIRKNPYAIFCLSEETDRYSEKTPASERKITSNKATQPSVTVSATSRQQSHLTRWFPTPSFSITILIRDISLNK